MNLEISVAVIFLLIQMTDSQNWFMDDVIAIFSQRVPAVKPYVLHQEITFKLHTRNINGRELNNSNLQVVSAMKPVKYLIHGFTGRKEFYIPIIADYLKKGDIQVITVDWTKGAYLLSGYISAMSNTKIVGEVIARQIYNLHTNYNIPLSNIHILGLSLGSHAAGIAGKYVINWTNGSKIDRISGLDPAGVLYNLPDDVYSSNMSLTKNDANFVDITHTDCNGFGMENNIGHVDFYVNGCKSVQPGCMHFQSNLKLNELFDDVFGFISCSHEKSTEYFQRSILNNAFVVRKCVNNFYDCKAAAYNVTFGENIDKNTTGIYYLEID